MADKNEANEGFLYKRASADPQLPPLASVISNAETRAKNETRKENLLGRITEETVGYESMFASLAAEGERERKVRERLEREQKPYLPVPQKEKSKSFWRRLGKEQPKRVLPEKYQFEIPQDVHTKKAVLDYEVTEGEVTPSLYKQTFPYPGDPFLNLDLEVSFHRGKIHGISVQKKDEYFMQKYKHTNLDDPTINAEDRDYLEKRKADYELPPLLTSCFETVDSLEMTTGGTIKFGEERAGELQEQYTMNAYGIIGNVKTSAGKSYKRELDPLFYDTSDDPRYTVFSSDQYINLLAESLSLIPRE